MPSKYCYFYKSPEHSEAMVLSFAFCFDVEEREKYEMALSYPYSYSRIKAIEQRIFGLRQNCVSVEDFAYSAVSNVNKQLFHTKM